MLPPSFGGLRAIFGTSWLVNALPQSLPLSSHGVLPVPVGKFPF